MTFFGWLTKPQLMVSFLDRLIMVVEIGIAIYCWWMFLKLKKNWDKK